MIEFAVGRSRWVKALISHSPTQIAFARAHGVHAVTYPQPWNDETRSARAVLDELPTLVQRISNS